MKTLLKKLLRLFLPKHHLHPDYVYPLDEKQFEEDPTKIRTVEMSQFQDEARDIETRNPEREVFEKEYFEIVFIKKLRV